MILKLGMYHQGLKLYKDNINDDPGLTLTYFTARSNWVTYPFEWGKLLHSHFMGETCSKGVLVFEFHGTFRDLFYIDECLVKDSPYGPNN